MKYRTGNMIFIFMTMYFHKHSEKGTNYNINYNIISIIMIKTLFTYKQRWRREKPIHKKNVHGNVVIIQIYKKNVRFSGVDNVKFI